MADHYSHYLQPRLRYSWQLWSIVVFIVGAACWAGFEAFQEYQQTMRIAERTDKLRASQAKTVAPKPSKQEEADVKKWADLKAERSFAWEPLFQAVERSANAEVELLEFQPDKSSHIVSLQGETKNQKALLTFLSTLAAQPALQNVHLVHQQSVVRDRLETVSFEIKATVLGN